MNDAGRSSHPGFAALMVLGLGGLLAGCNAGGAGEATFTTTGKAPEKITFTSGVALVESPSRVTMVTGCELSCDDYRAFLADDFVKKLGAKCGKFFEATFFKQTGKLAVGKYGGPGGASKTPVEANPAIWNPDATSVTFALFSSKAKADTIEITSVTDTEVAGKIHLDDGGTALEGQFTAKVCKLDKK
jgi:hypothetical protein